MDDDDTNCIAMETLEEHFDQNIFKRILHEIRVSKNLDAKFELDRLIERL